MSGPATGENAGFLQHRVGWRRRSDRSAVQRRGSGGSTEARLPKGVAGLFIYAGRAGLREIKVSGARIPIL